MGDGLMRGRMESVPMRVVGAVMSAWSHGWCCEGAAEEGDGSAFRHLPLTSYRSSLVSRFLDVTATDLLVRLCMRRYEDRAFYVDPFAFTEDSKPGLLNGTCLASSFIMQHILRYNRYASVAGIL